MPVKVSNKLKMVLDLWIGEHVPCVSTNWMYLSSFEDVSLVKSPARFGSWNGTLVNNSLTIVFTRRFQFVHFEQSVGCRIKFHGSMPLAHYHVMHFFAFDRNRSIFHQPRIAKSSPFGHVDKVVPIKGTRQAFSPEQFVFLQDLRNASVGVNVRKVHFTARFQEIVACFEHCRFVGAKINDAIANDDIKRPGIECFNLFERL
mmetsp:Transcript_11751/g.32544  ORF Transcript_11751/g.32544 Transcript_11751/m.32544 type:complete len:202 (-) Transcript_11751:239-844(-)